MRNSAPAVPVRSAADVAAEVEQRRVDALTAFARGHLLESFLVVALPATAAVTTASIQNEPQILYNFDTDAASRAASMHARVRHFCFPDGCSTELLAKTDSGSALQALLLSSDMQTFAFVLGNDDERLYGCVALRREPLAETASFVDDSAHCSDVSDTPM